MLSVVVFEQDNKPQVSRQEPEKFPPGCRRNHHFQVNSILFSDKCAQVKELEIK